MAEAPLHCSNCGERHTETHPMLEGKMTTRLVRAIERDARHLTITEIGRRYGLAWSTVMAIVTAHSGRPVVAAGAAAAGLCSWTRRR